MLSLLLLFSGIKGLPFGEDTIDGLDTLIQRHGRKFGLTISDLQSEGTLLMSQYLPQTFLGLNVANMVWRGILDETLGGTFSTRLGFGDIIPFSGVGKMGMNAGDYWREAQNGAGPVYSAGKDGFHTLLSFGSYIQEKVGLKDDTTKLLDIVRSSPVAGARAIADAWTYHHDGVITNKKGRVITRDVSNWEVVFRMLGFYPSIATRHNDVIRMAKYTNAHIRAIKSTYTQAYVKALVLKDRREARRIERMVRDWNREHRGTEYAFPKWKKQAIKSFNEITRPSLQRFARTLPTQTRPFTDKLSKIFDLPLQSIT